MDVSRVKSNLGKRVRVKLPSYHIDCDYIFNAYILRKNSRGKFCCQAELQDIKTNSIVIAGLGDIEEINDNETEGMVL